MQKQEEWVEDYHYWRECPKCGLAAGGYLHCPHDGAQSLCRRCQERLPELPGDCECEFVVTEKEEKERIQFERSKVCKELEEKIEKEMFPESDEMLEKADRQWQIGMRNALKIIQEANHKGE